MNRIIMAVSEDFLNYVEEQLSAFGGVESKKMFGGIGFFKEGCMFGLISKGDVFRLKVDQTNQADYEAYGMEPLHMKNKKRGMPYWQVPTEILDDKEKLSDWATTALEISLRNKKK